MAEVCGALGDARARRRALPAARALRGPQRRRRAQRDLQRLRVAAARASSRPPAASTSSPSGTSRRPRRCTPRWARGPGTRARRCPSRSCCSRAAGRGTSSARPTCSPTRSSSPTRWGWSCWPSGRGGSSRSGRAVTGGELVRRRAYRHRTMARASTAFVCSACAAETPRWMGQCPGCGEWNTLNEETRGGVHGARPAPAKRVAAVKPQRLHEVEAPQFARLKTGIGELDRILGGGLVPGLAGADRRLARDRQVDADVDGAREPRGRGAADAVRLRRGVGGADPAARRAAAGRGDAGPGAGRDRPGHRAGDDGGRSGPRSA